MFLPFSYDSNGSVYWYFYGTRLYREDYLSKKQQLARKAIDPNASDTVWQVVCFTEYDWRQLANKFKTSTNSKEHDLYLVLEESFLPKIPLLFKEKERQRRNRLIFLSFHQLEGLLNTVSFQIIKKKNTQTNRRI